MNKKTLYKQAYQQLEGLANIGLDSTAVMASISSVLRNTIDYYFWVGFYRVTTDQTLMIGPYQGTLACVMIDFGKGVVGTCAQQQTAIIVPDVHEFPGHIACDSRSNSEIVLPVFNNKNQLIAVLDVDSTNYDAFDEDDKQGLEKILNLFFRQSNMS